MVSKDFCDRCGNEIIENGKPFYTYKMTSYSTLEDYYRAESIEICQDCIKLFIPIQESFLK